MYWNTVSSLLRSLLEELMDCLVFNTFRLAGGTALALQLGHRVSGDINLFLDVTPDNIDFYGINFYLKRRYSYFSSSLSETGIQSFIGKNEIEIVKVDFYCTDPFIQPYQRRESIRIATVEESIAMKIDRIQRGGRKEDFWDLHELLRSYSLESMLELHKKRYPHSHNKELILEKLIDFTRADEDFEPICLKGKYWGLIKMDIIQIINGD